MRISCLTLEWEVYEKLRRGRSHWIIAEDSDEYEAGTLIEVNWRIPESGMPSSSSVICVVTEILEIMSESIENVKMVRVNPIIESTFKYNESTGEMDIIINILFEERQGIWK